MIESITIILSTVFVFAGTVQQGVAAMTESEKKQAVLDLRLAEVYYAQNQKTKAREFYDKHIASVLSDVDNVGFDMLLVATSLSEKFKDGDDSQTANLAILEPALDVEIDKFVLLQAGPAGIRSRTEAGRAEQVANYLTDRLSSDSPRQQYDRLVFLNNAIIKNERGSESAKADAHIRLKDAHVAFGDYPAAVASCEAAIKLHYDNFIDEAWKAYSHCEVGNIQQHHLKDYPAAIASFQKAIKLDSINHDWIAERHSAIAFIQKDYLKDYLAAIASYESAIKLHVDVPWKTKRQYIIGNIQQHHLKDYPAAIASYEAAIKLYPGDTALVFDNPLYDIGGHGVSKNNIYETIAKIYEIHLNDPAKAQEWRDKIK
jgi:tetratricopeptide (TPR) repeat protein